MKMPRNVIIIALWARLIVCTALVVITAPLRFLAWIFMHHLEYLFVWFLAIVYGGLLLTQGNVGIDGGNAVQLLGAAFAVAVFYLIFRIIRAASDLLFEMLSPFYELNLKLLERRADIIDDIRYERSLGADLNADVRARNDDNSIK